jgi:hypothetical protein
MDFYVNNPKYFEAIANMDWDHKRGETETWILFSNICSGI